MAQHMINDIRIGNTRDGYISYAVGEEDWQADGQIAWGDVTGTKLDPDKSERGMREQIDERHTREVYSNVPID